MTEKAKQARHWQNSITKRPEIGDRVLVKLLLNDTIYFAIYTNEDEFDVHRPNEMVNHRESWFKFSHRSVTWWRYF